MTPQIAASAAVLSASLLSASASVPPAVPVRVVDIQAKLFCAGTGELSADVIGEQPALIWNTSVISPDNSSDRCTTHETLALVVVEAPPSTFIQGVTVDFQARYRVNSRTRADTVIRYVSRLGITGSDGRYYVPMLLTSTGCFHVTLRAVVRAADSPSSREEVVPFECGE
jgi:hypothetical protein